MLEQARRRPWALEPQHAIADLLEGLPAGPWDAIVSALAIHHLADEDKWALFARVHASLRDRGVFVNAEQVAGPTPFLEARYRAWLAERTAALGGRMGRGAPRFA